jgi:hypothetical protein
MIVLECFVYLEIYSFLFQIVRLPMVLIHGNQMQKGGDECYGLSEMTLLFDISQRLMQSRELKNNLNLILRMLVEYLDALAKNGVRFKQFYNGARCCPTRAGLMTGC